MKSLSKKINSLKFDAITYRCEGRIEGKKGNYAQAVKFYLKSIDSYKAANLIFQQAKLCGWTGNMYYAQGNIPMALEYFIKAVNIYELYNKMEPAAGYMGNIGAIYEVMGKYESAGEWYQKSLKLNRKINAKQNIAINLVCIGNLKLDFKLFDSAIKYLNEALVINLELGDSSYICNNYGSLANCFSSNQNHHKALEYALKAKSIAKIIGDDKEYLISTMNQAKSLIYLNKPSEVKLLIQECEKLTKEYPSNELKRNLYKIIAEYYELEGNLKKQIYYYKLHVAYKDSILNEANNEKLALQQAQYEYDKKAAADSVRVADEKKLTTLKFNQEKKQRYLLYGCLSLTVIFGVFMFNRFRITKKQKIIIEEQKILVEKQKELVDQKQKEVMDSIKYARKIQQTLLPSEKYIKNKLN